MKRNFVYISETKNAHENMATDEWFLDHVGEDELILFLYQNENAVIIGKNQNPWVECDLERMKEDGVQLARRISGGGAVYHDLGNINFSFIAGRDRYDQASQLSLILTAVQSLGIPCEFSGRNDILCNGKKVSGNAFADRKGKKMHHGTLLVSSDLERLSRYLTVDPKKIASKGIASVRSRVCNLVDFIPDLTLRQTQNALLRALENRDGYFGEFAFTNSEKEELSSYIARHSDPEWYLGQTPKFDLEWKERFPWGSLQLFLRFEKGRIISAEAYSDSMDTFLCEKVCQRLMGIMWTQDSVREALLSSEVLEIKELGKSFTV